MQTTKYDYRLEIVKNNLALLNEVRHILFDTYVNKLQWKITIPNPSGIQIKETSKGSIIIDDYDESATWFILRHEQQIVSCARLCYADKDGLLEIERYQSAHKILKQHLKNKSYYNLVEFNREAIIAPYVKKKECYLILLKNIFKYCLSNGHTILTTTNLNGWLNIYDELGFPKIDSIGFKYHENDPKSVNVYIATESCINKMLIKIESSLQQPFLLGT